MSNEKIIQKKELEEKATYNTKIVNGLSHYFNEKKEYIGYSFSKEEKETCYEFETPKEWEEELPYLEPVYIYFTFGTTPENIILNRLPEHYEMELVGDDAEVLREVVNQGIDSHLEAVFGESEWKMRMVGETPVLPCLACGYHKKSMLVILRRLSELAESDYELAEEAWNLRTAILTTIEIGEE